MFSHEIRRISKDQLPGMVSPIFHTLLHRCHNITYPSLNVDVTVAGVSH